MRRILRRAGALFGFSPRSGGQGEEHPLVAQAMARGVRNPRILKAFGRLDRAQFMPERLLGSALVDNAFPIGEGQTISQPSLVARMTELLDPKAGETVLEIGTGSGYQAALLGLLARRVITVEILPALAHAAAARLSKGGFANVSVELGDGFLGWEDQAPYDGIMVSCAVERVPEPLVSQLKEGGRMVLPLGGQTWGQRLTLLVKLPGGEVKSTGLLDVQFVPLLGPHGKEGATR